MPSPCGRCQRQVPAFDATHALFQYQPPVDHLLKRLKFSGELALGPLLGELLAEQNICAWSGHFYALKAVEVMGLLERGGVTRLGLSAYSSENDIDRTIEAFKKITNS